MNNYTVLRHHQGDKDYKPGDVRSASHADVAHLIRLGVLEVKAEKRLENKADKPVQNKADYQQQSKAKT